MNRNGCSRSPEYALDGHQIFVTGSIGIVLFPQDGMQAEALLKNADMGMYQAKSQGSNQYVFYESCMNDKIMQRLQLENALRDAIETGSMTLNYQPTANLQTMQVECVEAL
ncbi:MAG TPA: diguanylate cyclase [Gammaproteobacteria bacterium]|nr:diguanylate cyclase [Gammaproteobacteria bacterium]